MKGYVYVGKELIEKVQDIVEVDYEAKGDLIEISSLVDMVQDLIKERENLIYKFDEKVEDLKDMKTEDIDFEYDSFKEMEEL